MMSKGSICRNCFHSYVCEQFNENKDDNNEKCHFFNDHYVPTTDVVPKSEYEAVVSAVDNSTKEFLKLHDAYQNAKAEVEQLTINMNAARLGMIAEHERLKTARVEVAREIFAEIEREIEEALKSNYKVLPQLEFSNELYNSVRGKIDALRGIDGFIAELEKKYTESCTDCKHFVGCETACGGRTCDEYEGVNHDGS